MLISEQPESEEFSLLPDEMIMHIVEYLDSVSLLCYAFPISKQFYRISHEKLHHMEISSHEPQFKYQFIHQCTYFRTLTSLDLSESSIGVEDFKRLIQSRNLVELKFLSLPSEGDCELVLEIGNLYNECLEEYKTGIEVEFCLPKLKCILLEHVCQLNLINPIEYCKQMKVILQGKKIKNLIKSNKGEFFGKSKELETILEGTVLPSLFPELFKGSRSAQRSYFLFGPMKSGKNMILDALNDSLPCNIIEPHLLQYNYTEIPFKMLFNISKVFSKHALSLLEFRQDPLTVIETEGERNRRALSEFLIQLDSRKEGNLALFLCISRPASIEPSLRRRLFPKIYIKLLTGDDLLIFVKYQLEKRLFDFTMNQINEITKLCEGYSPFEIEEMIKSIDNIWNQNGFVDCLRRIIEKSPPINPTEIIKENDDFATFINEY